MKYFKALIFWLLASCMTYGYGHWGITKLSELGDKTGWSSVGNFLLGVSFIIISIIAGTVFVVYITDKSED